MPPPPQYPRRVAGRGAGKWLLFTGVGACVLVLVVAVGGLAGALDEVPDEGLPTAVEDEVDEGEPWNVTVDGAALAADLRPASLREDGYWLVVIAEVEVTADESRSDLHHVLYVTGVDGLARDPVEDPNYPGGLLANDIRVVRDGTEAARLQPGMVERLAYLWELASDTPPPAEVDVEITSKTLRTNSLNGHQDWLDQQPRAVLTLPVQDRRDEGEDA